MVVIAGRGFDGERWKERSVKCILYYYLIVCLYYFNGLNVKIETGMLGEL